MPSPNALLVINAGSSSFKYKVFAMPEEEVLAYGHVERIGEPEGNLAYTRNKPGVPVHEKRQAFYPSPSDGMRQVAELLLDPQKGVLQDTKSLMGVGHRVLLGGPEYTEALVDEDVKNAIRKYAPLGPLHNPANLMGIEMMEEIFPTIPNVAVFDTDFHASMPEHAYTYAIPRDLAAKHSIRRLGFHGTSYKYVSREAAEFLGIPLDCLNIVACHLGNGSSAAAIQNGKSIDTSMGLTPQEGLVMGTRAGDLDASAITYLMMLEGFRPPEMLSILNTASGLKGLCGHNDMRDLLNARAAGDQNADLAFTIFCYRVKKYIGSYLAALGRTDALVFTGGIGANSPEARAEICKNLEHLGLILDPALNESPGQDNRMISTADSPRSILVIPTNEELEIARSSMQVLARNSH